MDAREVAYKDIISSTFAAINGELFFQNKKFYHKCGKFYVADEKSKNHFVICASLATLKLYSS